MKRWYYLLFSLTLSVGCGDGLYFNWAGPGSISGSDAAVDQMDQGRVDEAPLPDHLPNEEFGPDVPQLVDAVDVLPPTDQSDGAVEVAVDSPQGEVSEDVADATPIEDRAPDADVTAPSDVHTDDVADAADIPLAVDSGSDAMTVDVADVRDVLSPDVPADMAAADVPPDVVPDAGGMDVLMDVPADASADVASEMAVDIPADVAAEDTTLPPVRIRILYDHVASGVPLFTRYYGTYSMDDPTTGWSSSFCEGGIHTVTYNGTPGWSECYSTVPATHGWNFLFAPQGFCQSSCDFSLFRYFRFEYQGRVYSGDTMDVLQRAFGVGPVAGYDYVSSLRFLFPPS